MKKEDLLQYIGSVDDRYIDEILDENIRTTRNLAYKRNRLRAIAASLALIILGTGAMILGAGDVERSDLKIPGNILNLTLAKNSVIMIDVNPSIRMEVNDRGIVIDVEALNDDAESFAAELDIKGKTYEVAVANTVEVLQKHEYITNLKNSILVTVMDKDKEQAETIRNSIVESILKIDEGVEYNFSILSQTMTNDKKMQELAQKFSISTGRAWLISEFCESNKNYSFDDIVKNNIQTINQLFEYIGVPDFVKKIGTAAGTVPADHREKLGIADLKAKEMISFTCAVSDFYDNLCKYYKESDVAKQIGYAFTIAEGKSKDGNKIWALVAESLTKNVANHCGIITSGNSSVSDWFKPDTVHEVTDFIVKGIKKLA